uniref:G-protein coupled receptors family 1 profile domain-containing protein n=1 Tax=Parascaris equorum TaxID=6256 RepID=A0A914RGI5_PAREQ
MAIFRGAVKIPGTEFEQCYPVIDRYSDEVLLLFNLFHVITTFYVPLTIVVVCYTLIGLSLRRQMAQRKTLNDEKRYAMMCATRIRFLKASIPRNSNDSAEQDITAQDQWQERSVVREWLRVAFPTALCGRSHAPVQNLIFFRSQAVF